jgi:hypothetical protein
MRRILITVLFVIAAVFAGGVAFAEVQPATGNNFHWTSTP